MSGDLGAFDIHFDDNILVYFWRSLACCWSCVFDFEFRRFSIGKLNLGGCSKCRANVRNFKLLREAVATIERRFQKKVQLRLPIITWFGSRCRSFLRDRASGTLCSFFASWADSKIFYWLTNVFVFLRKLGNYPEVIRSKVIVNLIRTFY